jgi:hypothetical protein
MQHEEGQDAPSPSRAPTERYWDWPLHEDDLFSNRLNFFLVAESMLLIAFAINSYEISNLTKVLGAAGILAATLWCYVSAVQIFSLINPIKIQLRRVMPEYKEIKDISLLADPNIWLGVLFPLLLMGIWAVLIIQK